MSWGKQFERSLHGRDPEGTGEMSDSGFDLILPTEPIEEYAAKYIISDREQTDSDRVALAAIKPLLAVAWRKLYRDIEEIWPYEWPTETAMFFALYILARDHFDGVSFERGIRGSAGDLEVGLEHLTIAPQARLGDYRVDFLLRLNAIGPDYSSESIAPDGKLVVGTKRVSKTMIVECDGHEFHEKTKEQVRKDKQRDRTLQSLGFLVFRYPGSDIWRDVFACAAEALTVLRDAASSELNDISLAEYYDLRTRRSTTDPF